MTQPTTEPSASPAPSATPTYRQLLSTRNYRHLISAQFVSDFGDAVYALGLIWAMKQLTGSAAHMSGLLIAELLPFILIGMFAGVYVDHGRKRSIMIYADLWRGLTVTSVAVLWSLDLLQPWMLIVAACILSIFSAFFQPARAVSVRTLVEPQQMMKAQAFAQTIQTVVGLSAPAIAGVLLYAGMGYTFYLNAASYFLSLFFLSRIRHDALNQKQQGSLNLSTVKKGLGEGLRTILKEPILRNLILYAVLLNFMFAPVTLLVPLYAKNAAELATYETMFFIGILGGSLLAGQMGRFHKIVPLTGGLFLLMLGFLGLGLSEQFWLSCACLLLAGIGSPLPNVTVASLFAVKVPREVLGRAHSTMSVLVSCAKPLGLAIAGGVLAWVSVPGMFVAIAVFGLIIVLMMLANPVVRRAE